MKHLYAECMFVDQAAVLDAQEYPQTALHQTLECILLMVYLSTWAGFEGYRDGTTSTPDSCGRIIDERVIRVVEEAIVLPMEGMHFSISYGVPDEHESRLSEAANSDIDY